MALKQIIKYESPIKKLKSENDILLLLENVRNDIRNLEPLFNSKSLKEVVKIIEHGSYQLPISLSSKIKQEIDLSEAQSLLKIYHFLSEGICNSCQLLEITKDEKTDEKYKFCRHYETPKSIDYGKGMSQKVYEGISSNNPCENRKPIFRKLEQVIKQG